MTAYAIGSQLGDNVSPTVTGFTQSLVSADNSLGTTARTITLHFSASEYLAETVPTFRIVEAGGDPAYVIPAGNVTFAWDANRMGGTFNITIPAGADGSGDNFIISSITDTSGNTMAAEATPHTLQ